MASRRLLALGDSYTIGEGVPPEARWPSVVAARLRASGVDLAEPAIVAETGWTTDELAAGIDAAAPEAPFDLVTLLIGVNDQYRARGADTYREPYRALLRRAIAFASGEASRVVAISIPDWGVTAFGAQDARGPEAIGREIDLYNAIAREEAARAGAAWACVTPLSRTQGTRTVDDDLHPDAAAYAAWADVVAPLARRALGA
jgi:lysophospholipase L1-like esterase